VVPGRMATGIKIDEKLDGVDNFRAWRYIITLLLEEHDLDTFIKEEVQEPEGNEAKERARRSNLHLRSLRRVEETTQTSDVSVVKNWDTLLGIVPSLRK
jgi:hypothetical protein